MLKMRSEPCLACKECCKYMGIVYDFDKFTSDLYEFYLTRGCKIKRETDKIYILVPATCSHLTFAGCSIYKDRPTICRNYDGRKDPAMKDICVSEYEVEL